MTNIANDALTDIGWGWFVDYKGSSARGYSQR